MCDSCGGIIGTAGARAFADACEISRARIQSKRQVFGMNVVSDSLHSARKQVPVSLQVSGGVATAIVTSLVHSACPAVVQVEMPLPTSVHKLLFRIREVYAW
jgi:hypothetical protein